MSINLRSRVSPLLFIHHQTWAFLSGVVVSVATELFADAIGDATRRDLLNWLAMGLFLTAAAFFALAGVRVEELRLNASAKQPPSRIALRNHILTTGRITNDAKRALGAMALALLAASFGFLLLGASSCGLRIS